MGHPPKQGHLDAADFSADFLRIFCVTLEYLFFKRQNVEEKSAPRKICAPRICAKNRFAHCKKPFRTFRFSGRWKPEQKNTRKICAKLDAKPQPQEAWGKGRGERRSLVFLKPSKISLHSIPPQWGPLGPPPFLWAREEESGRVRELSAAEIPEPRP